MPLKENSTFKELFLFRVVETNESDEVKQQTDVVHRVSANDDNTNSLHN